MERVYCIRIWYTYVRRRTLSAHCFRWFHSYVHYRYDDSTLSTTTSQLPFDYTRNTVRRFHSYQSLHAIPQMPLMILTALMPFNKSASTLWGFSRWSADYSHNESADIVKFLVTCTVIITALILLACFAQRNTCTIDLKACYLIRVYVCEICCSQEFKVFFRIHASSLWKGHSQSASAFTGNSGNFRQDTVEFVRVAQLVKSTVLGGVHTTAKMKSRASGRSVSVVEEHGENLPWLGTELLPAAFQNVKGYILVSLPNLWQVF